MSDKSLQVGVSIVGTGSHLPKRVLSNKELEKMVDTTDEWIVSRTGMKERRIAGASEFTSDMGTEAAKEALKSADISANDVDLILVATLTPDYTFPSTACMIQEQLGAKNAVAFDIQAACTGFIYALSVAKAFVESSAYKNVLVVASEKLSSIVDYEDRNTCVLFGDGASACVVTKSKGGLHIGSPCLGSDGAQGELLMMQGGGCRNPASKETVDERLHYIQMNGREIYKHAVIRMQNSAIECIKREGLAKEQITYLVPHQANVRIIEAIAKRCDIPMERVMITVNKYGNTSASSIGIGLDELLVADKVSKGDRLLLVAFGAGLTWGSVILTAKGNG